MTTITRTNPTYGYVEYVLNNANQETELQAVERGKSMIISATGMASATAQILWYSKPGATGVPLTFEGSSSFTSDFAYNFEAGGKGFITVKLTVGGAGDTTVVFSK